MDPIVVSMEPNEEALIGNMVATNTGDQTVTLSVVGAGPVLRRAQVIGVEDAVSPALKIYYLVTSIYIHPPLFAELNAVLSALSRELVLEVPTMGEFVADVGEFMAAGDYRQAHDKCLELLSFEHALEEIGTKGA